MGIRAAALTWLFALGSAVCAAELTADDVRELAARLDDNDYAVREAASQKLLAAGADAIEPCVELAQDHSYEVSYRAVEVLKSLRGQSATHQAADDALQKLTTSEHEVAARLASDVYAAERLPARSFPERYQRRYGFGGGRQMRFGRRIFRGNGHVEARDGNRSVVIDRDAQGAISMSVTENNGNAGVTQKYTARDANELRREHPQAYLLYLRYGGGVGFGVRDPRQQIEDMQRQAEQLRAQALARQAERSQEFDRVRQQQRQAQIELLEKIIDLHERQGRPEAAEGLKRLVEQLRQQ